MLGYTKDLFILPFDHRSSFTNKMFGATNREPNDEEIRKTKEAKRIIYSAFKKSLLEDMPRDSAAILVDEEFGDEILRDARDKGYTTILTTEKSGSEEFEFEYKDRFSEHIEKYNPTFVKALVRYNPEGEKALNARQREKLSTLTKFAHEAGYKFLIEPLVPATVEQLAKMGSDPDRYDKEMRPNLTTSMIRELQDGGVEPDIWKLEGMEEGADYEMVVNVARRDGRDEVGIVVLGRAADSERVEHWLKIGAKARGVVGFAVGRTIFWDPLLDYFDGKIEKGEAEGLISKKFLHFYHVFIEARRGL